MQALRIDAVDSPGFALHPEEREGPVSGAPSPSPYFLIRKSSGFLPFFTSAAIQRGCLPRPVQVSSGLAGLRYFGATFPSLRPWREAFFAGAFFAARPVVPVAARPPNSSSMEYPSAAANSTIRPRIAVMGLRFFSAVLQI